MVRDHTVDRMDDEDFDAPTFQAARELSISEHDSGEGSLSPETQDMKEQSELRAWLRALLDDPTLEHYKDVTFQVRCAGKHEEDCAIRAHRLILATRSQTFARIMDREDDKSKPLSICDIDAETLRILIRYIYTGKLQPPKRVLETVNVMYAAKLYDIPHLYDLIKQFLLRRLPEFQTKHFIMVTQTVLDLNLTDLEDDCFRLVEQNTDSVVMDPFFLRVRSNFIAKLLELDAFTGVSEATVFTRVLEWANLHTHSGENGVELDVDHAKENGFELQRPKVRKVMEPFIYEFRLVSIPKDDLASLTKNSGVFTEREQLVISYYLLDQTKNLGDFTMKKRGRKHRESPRPMERKHKEERRKSQSSPSPPVASPVKPVVAPQKPPPPVAPPVRQVPPVPSPERVRLNETATMQGLANSDVDTTKIISEAGRKVEPSSDFANGSAYTEAKPAPVRQSVSPTTSTTSDAYRDRPRPPVKEQSPDRQSLVGRFKNKFAMDKKKPEGETSKGKKDKDKLSQKKSSEPAKPVPAPRPPVTTSSGPEISRQSSTSSSSSASVDSPRAHRGTNQVTPTNSQDDTAVVTKRTKSHSVSNRPKSVLVDGKLIDKTNNKEKDTVSVGKSSGMKNAIAEFMSKTTKWTPEKDVDSHRPQVPPRVKVVGHSPVPNAEIIAEI